MGFPFLSSLNSYVKPELQAQTDPIKFGEMMPWIKVTSNLSPGKTLESNFRTEVFGAGDSSMYNTTRDVYNGPTFKPKPIVTGFSVDFSDRGVTRTGTIKFKCFTLRDFEEIQEFFLEPGISVFVQWGWNKSSLSGQSIIAKPVDATTQLKYYRTNETLIKDRAAANGCYDNFLGIITGGKAVITGAEYEIECKLTAIGEILMGGTTADPGISCDNKSGTRDPVKAFKSSEMKDGRSDDRHSFHWMAFFNTLPDGIKNITGLKKWGNECDLKFIDPRVDFINYDDDAMADAKDEADGAILFTDTFTVAGKTIKGQDSDVGSPIYQTKYIRFKALVNIMNYIISTVRGLPTPVNARDSTSAKVGIDISNSYCGATNGMFSCDPSCFIPNEFSTNFMELNAYFNNLQNHGVAAQATRAALILSGGVTGLAELFSGGAISDFVGDLTYTPEQPFMDNSVRGIDDTKVSFPITEPATTVFNGQTIKFNPGKAGKLENLYINHDLAVECINAAFNNSVKDCLDNLLKNIEKASVGLWDFQVIVPDDKNSVITIIDCNVDCTTITNSESKATKLKDGKPEVTFFSLYSQNEGDKSIFLDFEFDSNIPKGMMNMITMEKSTGTSTSTGTADSNSPKSTTKGRGLFTDQKDMVITETIKTPPNDPCASPNEAKSSNSNTKEDQQQDFDGFVKTSKILLQPKYSIDSNPNTLDGLLIPGISSATSEELKKRQKAIKSGGNQAQPAESATPTAAEGQGGQPINSTIKFKIRGNSGFKVGDLITVNNLPKAYRYQLENSKKERGSFMVLKYTHTIDDKGWVSDIEAMFRPY